MTFSKMKLDFTLVGALVFLASCNSRPESTFSKLECEKDNVSENSNLKRVFKPCREYIYSAKYWDQDFNLISDEYIWMMATGRDWEYQPESQDEIAIQYRFDESQREVIDSYNLNPEFGHPWRKGEVTGVIETEDQVWMHPFRSNQYIFTEVAAFPSVRLPLEVGNTWNSGLNIYEGWGRWSDTSVNYNYQVLAFETIETAFKALEAWHVKSIAVGDFGTSVHDFWYHEEYGFVKMIVRNYGGQVLAFELANIKE